MLKMQPLETTPKPEANMDNVAREATPSKGGDNTVALATAPPTTSTDHTVVELKILACQPDCLCTKPEHMQHAHFHVVDMMHPQEAGGMLSPLVPTRVCCTDATHSTQAFPVHGEDEGTRIFSTDVLSIGNAPAPPVVDESPRTMSTGSSDATLQPDAAEATDREALQDAEAAEILLRMCRADHALQDARERSERHERQTQQHEVPNSTDVLGLQSDRIAPSRALVPNGISPPRADQQDESVKLDQPTETAGASLSPAQRAWHTKGLNNYLNELSAPTANPANAVQQSGPNGFHMTTRRRARIRGG